MQEPFIIIEQGSLLLEAKSVPFRKLSILLIQLLPNRPTMVTTFMYSIKFRSEPGNYRLSSGIGQDFWRMRLEMAALWQDAVNQFGGDVTLLHLPENGIYGNTHFPFSDLNNIEIADLMSGLFIEKDWIDNCFSFIRISNWFFKFKIQLKWQDA